ncbi:MAG TPA: ATP-binding protein, partial [Flavitalea sp.]|nr:ATP-binding protein [Flavitalea sp.]
AENIFGLFKQLHPKDIYKGSGIGLSLCQRVAENHNGIIYARGEENAGATFYIILPEKQVSDPERGFAS